MRPQLTHPAIRPCSLRTLYNRLLLRPCPYSSYTYAQALVGSLYCGVVLLCLLVDSPPLRTNWRRAGCIAVAQVPWVFLFATKNTLLELVGMGYEKASAQALSRRVRDRADMPGGPGGASS